MRDAWTDYGRLLLILLTFAARPLAADEAIAAASSGTLIVVQGAGGEAEFAKAFAEWRQAWEELAPSLGLMVHVIGASAEAQSDHDRLHTLLSNGEADPASPLWIVLIGHGTFTQGQAKFNLVGPDLAASELAEWLSKQHRPLAIINCSSCSGPFLESLSGPNRVVVTATRSGAEQNFARFGQFLAQSIHDPLADLDHDGTVSLLEAYLSAARRTQAFYSDAARLATEHALLDDNGDRVGTSAGDFSGIHAVPGAEPAAAPTDGRYAHQWTVQRITAEPALSPAQLAERAELESAIETLRAQRASSSEDQYFQQLEPILIRLARLYEEFAPPDADRQVDDSSPSP